MYRQLIMAYSVQSLSACFGASIAEAALIGGEVIHLRYNFGMAEWERQIPLPHGTLYGGFIIFRPG